MSCNVIPRTRAGDDNGPPRADAARDAAASDAAHADRSRSVFHRAARITLIVSFWDFNEYQIIPAFTLKNYVAIFDGCSSMTDVCVDLQDLLVDAEVLRDRSGR